MIPLYAAHSKWVIFVLVFSITYEGMYPTKVLRNDSHELCSCGFLQLRSGQALRLRYA